MHFSHFDSPRRQAGPSSSSKYSTTHIYSSTTNLTVIVHYQVPWTFSRRIYLKLVCLFAALSIVMCGAPSVEEVSQKHRMAWTRLFLTTTSPEYRKTNCLILKHCCAVKCKINANNVTTFSHKVEQSVTTFLDCLTFDKSLTGNSMVNFLSSASFLM